MFWKRLWRNSKGQSLVEFALISLLMVVVILGTIDVGIMLYRYNALQSLGKDVVRAASVGDYPDNLRRIAERDAAVILRDTSSTLSGNMVTVTGSNGSIRAFIEPARNLRRKGEIVSVRVTYTYQPVSFFLPNEINLSTTSKTLMEKSTL